MAKIREDLVGSVLLRDGLILRAGDVVPDGVTVGDHVLAPAPADKPVEPTQEPAEVQPAPKRRRRPVKSEE